MRLAERAPLSRSNGKRLTTANSRAWPLSLQCCLGTIRTSGTSHAHGLRTISAPPCKHAHALQSLLLGRLKNSKSEQLEWQHLFYRGAPKSSKNKKNILRTVPLVRNFPLKVAANFLDILLVPFGKGVAIHAYLSKDFPLCRSLKTLGNEEENEQKGKENRKKKRQGNRKKKQGLEDQGGGSHVEAQKLGPEKAHKHENI